MSTAHCFTYGSLMWADIMARVCGREFASEPASLAGHSRHPVRGQDYPGLRLAPEGCVPGRLYRDVDAAAWARLDAFEGEEYERVEVPVALADGRSETAWVYRFRPAFAERLLPGAWDADAFEREGHARFTARYVGFELLTPR
ncbi:gamma-glutamylcyclotransferase [Pelomonas sp. UHG3]|uniref:Gamma-glutamylcyclotransferase n=1 Tax=Roseateles hydrophilus TaxID=2975054 RepID=A0ACC6CAA8_9BURK|nr:gamma-glutamylcyclotransferase family protein [Pelomonas sp. UHG3]MCY4745220.1 gamma-glutamylcyclotransferase [Pelomonas sp. UHG3]